jgi:hypothetical protein|uniref:Uncharacterized protein n=1 Tax=viral metagenome TaxID=1070528 RepID=A0A6C0IRC9_9ZZZZ
MNINIDDDDIENQLFQEWLDEDNFLNENDPDVRYKLCKYYNSILEIVKKAGYTINNKKEFKNELATMIYKLSYAKT